MVISNEKLIARLGDKTGLDAKKAEDLLLDLVEEIQETAEKGKPYEIQGFGIFTVKNEALHFTPAAVLETEINNKYAGMKPIELIGAFKESETGEMPEMTAESSREEEVWAFDQAQVSADKQDKEVEAERAETEAETDAGQQPEEVFEPNPEEPSLSEDTEPVEEPEEEKTDEEDIQPEPAMAAPEGEDADSDAEALSEAVSAEKSPEGSDDDIQEPALAKENKGREKPEKDPIGRFLAVAASILLIATLGWLGYEFLLKNNTMSSDRALSNDSGQQEQVPSQPVKDVQNEDEADNAENEAISGEAREEGDEKTSEPEEGSQVINDEGSTSQSVQQEDPAQEEPYGLRGDVEASLNSWYTIVVHSLQDAGKAEANRQQLIAEGYRATIKSVQLGDALQYRVGIGQFPTIEEALKASGELSEPYKTNNFIKRF